MPTTRFPRQLVAALLLAAVGVLPACDTEPTEPPNTDEIYFGVNYTRLFSEPTAEEIQAVKDDWSARNTETSGTPKTTASDTFDGAFHGILQHTVTSAGQENVIHYGVVRIPEGASDLPVLVIHHGGDDGLSISAGSANTGVQQWVAAFPQLAASTVQIWPVYRSEAISVSGSPIQGGPFIASGDPSPWDYDVDDSIAFLDATLDRWDAQTDDTRIAAMGMSRGANTALLHAIRDPRIAAVTNYYGPSDFYNESAQELASGVLTGNAGALSLPGAQYLYDTVLNPLRNEDASYNASADYDGARLEVLRRSASWFTDDLPDTQVHHHYGDGVVPFTFSQALKDRVDARGTPATFEFYAYGDTTDTPSISFHAPELTPAMQPSLDRTESFLLNALGVVGAATRVALAY